MTSFSRTFFSLKKLNLIHFIPTKTSVFSKDLKVTDHLFQTKVIIIKILYKVQGGPKQETMIKSKLLSTQQFYHTI